VDLVTLGQKISGRYSQTRRGYPRVPRMRAYLRIVSNIGLIIGQIVLLFASRDAGLSVIICSSLLSLPYFLKERMWDVMALICFMMVVNVVGLFVR